MSPVTMQSKDQEEDLLNEADDELDTEAEVEESDSDSDKARQPALSDSRRRRLRARGIDPDAALTSVKEDSGLTASKGRPTPSRDGNVVASRNPVVRFVNRAVGGFVNYIHDVRAELGRVTWLSRPDLLRLSYIVLGVTAASAAFLGLVSFLFGSLAGALAQNNSVIAAVIAIGLIIIVSVGWVLRDRLFPELE